MRSVLIFLLENRIDGWRREPVGWCIMEFGCGESIVNFVASCICKVLYESEWEGYGEIIFCA